MKTKIKEHLEKLKDSKIVNSDFYYIDLNNLCDAISLLSRDASQTIELIQQSKSIEACEHLITELQKRFWVIDTLSENIKEKVCDNNFLFLDSLFYWYREQLKENEIYEIDYCDDTI